MTNPLFLASGRNEPINRINCSCFNQPTADNLRIVFETTLSIIADVHPSRSTACRQPSRDASPPELSTAWPTFESRPSTYPRKATPHLLSLPFPYLRLSLCLRRIRFAHYGRFCRPPDVLHQAPHPLQHHWRYQRTAGRP